jgi:hypothetical protein
LEVKFDQEAMRQFEEELFWEDCWARNEDDTRSTKRKYSQAKPAKAAGTGVAASHRQEIVDDSNPF